MTEHLKHAPRTANEILLDLAVRHAHYFERLKSWLVNRVLQSIEDDPFIRIKDLLERRLESAFVDRLLLEADLLISQGFGLALGNLTDELWRVGRAEARWQAGSLEDVLPEAIKSATKVLPFQVGFTEPAPVLIRAAVTSNPFAGKILGDWWKGQEERTKEIVRQTVTVGVIEGKTTEEIVRELIGTPEQAYVDGAVQEIRRNVTSIVRTATTSVATEARTLTNRANADIVKGWQFVATLDSRTTLVCIAHDGKVYDVGDDRERPPLHWGCRSTTVPVLKSWAELGIPGMRELPAGTRASMNGQVPATLTYGEWLRRQPASFQDEVLGPERARLFRSGKVKVEQFVRDRRVLSLDELLAAA